MKNEKSNCKNNYKTSQKQIVQNRSIKPIIVYLPRKSSFMTPGNPGSQSQSSTNSSCLFLELTSAYITHNYDTAYTKYNYR